MTKITPKDIFDSKILIPENWRIASSGHHFYKYGFSQYRNGCTDRSKLYQPLLVSVISFVTNLRFFYLAYTSEKSSEFHLLIGDFAYLTESQTEYLDNTVRKV